MKEEDLIYSLSKLDTEIIEDADPTAASGQKAVHAKQGLPKLAVAALAFACVIVFSGGIVWAMNSPAIRDFFFPNSKEEFKQVYTEVGKEYALENYSLKFEGSAYEEAVQQGYLSFSLWDKEGNPANIEEALKNQNLMTKWLPNSTLTARFVHAYQIKIGTDECYFVSTYNNGLFVYPEDNNLYIEFARLKGDEDGKDYYKDKEFNFLVLNKEQWKAFNDDIGALNEAELCPISYDKENDRMIYDFDQDALLPEGVEVINKYDPYRVESITYAAQVIEVGTVKFTIGRANMLMDYNTNDCELGDFILKRADGTELKMIKQEQFYKNGNGEEIHSIIWQLENPEYSTGFGSVDNKTGKNKYGFNYGFILEPDEKVTIEADGQIYE